jgi:hypothetical protein
MVENGNAGIVRECWLGLPVHYPDVNVDAVAIVPDRIHGIMVLCHGDGTRPYTPKRSNMSPTDCRYPPPK